MLRPPPKTTRPDTLFPYTTHFRAPTVGEALQIMINLDTACRAQIAALAGGTKLTRISDAALESTADTVLRLADYSRDWAALRRLADRVAPGDAASDQERGGRRSAAERACPKLTARRRNRTAARPPIPRAAWGTGLP